MKDNRATEARSSSLGISRSGFIFQVTEMKTISLQVPPEGLDLRLDPVEEDEHARIVLVLPDGIELDEESVVATESSQEYERAQNEMFNDIHVQAIDAPKGYPPRPLTGQIIVAILSEHGGSAKIRDKASGWNIYDEIAARLGVTIEARQRTHPESGDPIWRNEVGYVRKTLEHQGLLLPSEKSGRGIWQLA